MKVSLRLMLLLVALFCVSLACYPGLFNKTYWSSWGEKRRIRKQLEAMYSVEPEDEFRKELQKRFIGAKRQELVPDKFKHYLVN